MEGQPNQVKGISRTRGWITIWTFIYFFEKIWSYRLTLTTASFFTSRAKDRCYYEHSSNAKAWAIIFLFENILLPLITPTPTYLFITRAKAKDAKIIIHQMPRPKVIIKCKKLKKTGKSCTKMDALHEHSPSKEDWPKGVWRTRSWIAIKSFMMLCPSPKPSDLYHQSQDQISGGELCWRLAPPNFWIF